MKHSQIQVFCCQVTAPSDMELVEQFRSGDDDAFGILVIRHHHAAIQVAHDIGFGSDPEILAQEAFTLIHESIRHDGGPQGIFRAHLYTVLRSVSMNKKQDIALGSSEEDPSSTRKPGISFEGQMIPDTVTARAFVSLKTEFRSVLWYMDLESLKANEAAPMLGLSVHATSTLVYQARDALETAWRQAHLNSERAEAVCRWCVERLGAHNEGTLHGEEKKELLHHLKKCLKCFLLVEEAQNISMHLDIFFLPLLLGPHAFSYMDAINRRSLADDLSPAPSRLGKRQTATETG